VQGLIVKLAQLFGVPIVTAEASIFAELAPSNQLHDEVGRIATQDQYDDLDVYVWADKSVPLNRELFVAALQDRNGQWLFDREVDEQDDHADVQKRNQHRVDRLMVP
jgi:hypothetical protein